jgi:hypothetical protein
MDWARNRGVGGLAQEHLIRSKLEIELLAAFLYRVPTSEPMCDLNRAPHAEVTRIYHLRCSRA